MYHQIIIIIHKYKLKKKLNKKKKIKRNFIVFIILKKDYNKI